MKNDKIKTGKNKKTKAPATALAALRRKAVKKLGAETERVRKLAIQDLNKLVHELGTHQIELEMQNEELRCAQAELESSRARYADLYDFSPVGYFSFDKNGLMKDVNLTGARMLGSAKRYLVNKPILAYINPVHGTIFRDHINEVFRTRSGASCELTLRKKDGTLLHAQLHSLAFSTGEGDPEVCRTAISDVTARKRAEETLKESEERFRTLTENSPDCIALHDPELRHLYVNPSIARIAGLPQEAFLGKTVWEVGMPRDAAATLDSLLRPALENRRAHSGELMFPSSDGQRFYAWRSVPIFNTDGSVTAILAIASEITERKRNEASLKKAKELSDALNRINKAVHSTYDFDEIMRRVIREAGEAIGCDSAAISLLKNGRWTIQYTHGFPQDVQGSHLHDEGQPHALKITKPLVINDAFHDERLDTEHMRKHGIRSVLIVPLVAGEEHLGAIYFNHHTEAVPFSLEQVDFADKLASTITLALENAELFEERKHARYELEAVNIELEAFSQSISHDLRAPLRTIEGFTTAILEDCAPTLDETGRNYFNRVVAASRRMSQLIEALLTMARLTKRELREQTVNLSALAEVIVYELRKKQPERQANFIIAPELKVRGDTDMLRSVLENLLDNAWKFSGKHPAAKIEFGAMQMEGRTVYFVRDDGAGFDMQYTGKLFMPFKRFHSETEFPGLGIGLATVDRIISRHGGRIWAETEVEKGATFYFTL